MDVLMDGLLATATLFAGCYCWVLGRRVQALKSLDKGLGGAIVTLTRQVELARTTLEEARAATGDSGRELGQLIARADTAAGQLRLLLASVREPEPRRAASATSPAPLPASAPASAPARVVESRQPLVLDEIEMATIDPPDAAAEAVLVPKPRALPPLENPLRRRFRNDEPPRSEEEILEALSSLAGPGR